MASQDAADFSVVLTATEFAPMQESFLRLYDFLKADGYPNIAELLRRAFFRLRDDALVLAKQTAVKARAYILEEERSSRVRPDTGGDGGPRLEDFLGESGSLNAVPGSVGVNFEPPLYDNVPWWWTNEEGYSGHVGRVVHGFFFEQGYTGASNPDPGLSREHPLFRAEGPQRDDNSFGPGHDRQPPRKGLKGERPGMRIENPIPQREFVLRGAKRAEAEWHTGFARIKAKFDAELVKIEALLRTEQAAQLRKP